MVTEELRKSCLVCGVGLKELTALPFCIRHFRVSDLRTCPICERPLPLTRRALYCREHQFEYELRQQHGVSASELDIRWGDTLASWRDRPSILEAEEVKNAHFQVRADNWLLFAYPRYLAVNLSNGEVRRFDLSTDVTEVWRNLLDAPPRPKLKLTAPPADAVQELLSHRRDYATREEFDKRLAEVLSSSDELRDRYSYLADNMSLTRLMYSIDLPVYGLEDKPEDLFYSGFSFQADNTGITISDVQFASFASSRSKDELVAEQERRQRAYQLLNIQWFDANPWPDDSRRRVTLSRDDLDRIRATRPPTSRSFSVTYKEQLPSKYKDGYLFRHTQRGLRIVPFPPTFIAYYLFERLPENISAQLGSEVSYRLCHDAARLCYTHAADTIEQLAASEVSLIERSVMVAGKEFAATVLCWPQPVPVCVYELSHEETSYLSATLSGSSYGYSDEQLFDLFSHLVPINARLDLLAQYEAERQRYYQHLNIWYHPENVG